MGSTGLTGSRRAFPIMQPSLQAGWHFWAQSCLCFKMMPNSSHPHRFPWIQVAFRNYLPGDKS